MTKPITEEQVVDFQSLWERHKSSAGQKQMEIDEQRFKQFIDQEKQLSRNQAYTNILELTGDEKMIDIAIKNWRKLRLTTTGGRKENPSETVLSVLKRGLGGLFDDFAVRFIYKKAIQYYLKELRASIKELRGEENEM